MSATRRGFILFGILVVVVAVFCYWLPFSALPRAGLGVGLPLISLPAEVLVKNGFLFGLNLTNTFTTLILIDVIVLLMALVVRRAVSAQAPDRFVPRGFTNFIDLLVEFWYNQARPVLGEHTRRVLPLALSIFLFVLVSNWSKLIPGFETVGIITCAEAGQPGYPLMGNTLKVDGAGLKDRAGVKATEADTEACSKAHPQFAPPAAAVAAATGGGDASSVRLVSNPLGRGQGATNQAAANPDLFNIIPYLRAEATDLNMTLALAVIAFFAVEIYGVMALGPAYFFKFINIPALGNLSKKPMGVMDFVVGLVEIISELSRLISLSFRLLGNLFAGGVLLAVMTFLVGGVLPILFLGLELFVGAIQSYVFAILTIMYTSQAVAAHHGEELEEEEAQAEAGVQAAHA